MISVSVLKMTKPCGRLVFNSRKLRKKGFVHGIATKEIVNHLKGTY